MMMINEPNTTILGYQSQCHEPNQLCRWLITRRDFIYILPSPHINGGKGGGICCVYRHTNPNVLCILFICLLLACLLASC